jgi:hypothetical protein
MSAEIIVLDHHRYPWTELLSLHGAGSTLQVHMNSLTGEVEFTQMNDEGEAIRTSLTRAQADSLRSALCEVKNPARSG